jgi:hypothetical protein
MVAGMWWFFTLIMISSYTANLAGKFVLRIILISYQIGDGKIMRLRLRIRLLFYYTVSQRTKVNVCFRQILDDWNDLNCDWGKKETVTVCYI